MPLTVCGAMLFMSEEISIELNHPQFIKLVYSSYICQDFLEIRGSKDIRNVWLY